MPFLSRASGNNFAEAATFAILNIENVIPKENKITSVKISSEGKVVDDLSVIPSKPLRKKKKIYGVKVSTFSFDRLPGADVLLSVTM